MVILSKWSKPDNSHFFHFFLDKFTPYVILLNISGTLYLSEEKNCSGRVHFDQPTMFIFKKQGSERSERFLLCIISRAGHSPKAGWTTTSKEGRMKKIWVVIFLIALSGIPLIGKADIINWGIISYCNLAGEDTTTTVSNQVQGVQVSSTGTIEIQNITLSNTRVPAGSTNTETIMVEVINHSSLDTFTLKKSSLNFSLEDKDITSEYTFDTPPSFSVVTGKTEKCTFTITKTGFLNGQIKIKVNLELDTAGNNILINGWTEITAYTEKAKSIILAQKDSQGETLASLDIPGSSLEKDAVVIITQTITDASLQEQINNANNAIFNNLGYTRDEGLNKTIWEFKALELEDTSVLVEISNTATIRITLFYKGTLFDNSVTEDTLKIYRLQGSSWVIVSGMQTINKNRKTVSVIVNSLSVYRILGLKVASIDLKNVIVFPNPYNPALAHNGELKFINLTENVQLYIYNVAGEKVWEKIAKDNNSGQVNWDGCNNEGNKVGSGIYFYLIVNTKDSSDKASGKIGLVR